MMRAVWVLCELPVLCYLGIRQIRNSEIPNRREEALRGYLLVLSKVKYLKVM